MAHQYQSHRISVCDRHPSATPATGGFCASCLRERLAGIDPSTHQEIPNHCAPRPDHLRRCKSYSAARHEGAAAEPRRKSCDARCRNSLSDLFDHDDGRKFPRGDLLSGLREEDENEIEESRARVRENAAIDRRFDDDLDEEMELKTMKEFIDLEWGSKKQKKKDIRVLWEAASVFGQKLRKLRRKDKIKNGGGSVGDLVEAAGEVNSRKLRDTQSEVGEYGGLGRRSCDTDPRLSLDAARFSVDDVRCSFDEPRASWDGYLVGGTARSYHHHLHHPHHHHQRFNPMVSFLEDVKVIDSMLKNRVIVEEKLNVVDEEERSPGGTLQTRDYYKEPLGTQRRRRSFERSNSQRKGAFLEVDELKSMANAKVSPTTRELFYGAKLLIAEGKLMDSNSKNAKDECLVSVESDPKAAGAVVGGADTKGNKKLHRWGKVWNIWSVMQKRGESKCLDERKSDAGGFKDQALPEAWQRLKRVSNGGHSRSYSVSTENSGKMAGSIHGNGNAEAKGMGTRMREDSVLQRNQSMKYSPSPSNLDSGLLRFYLTPLRSYRSKSVKSRLKKAHNVSKGVI